MRIFLKFILAFLLIYFFLNSLPKDYTPRVSHLDIEVRKLISAFGIQERDLITSMKKSFRRGNRKFLYLGRQYRIHPDFPGNEFDCEIKKLVKTHKFKDDWGYTPNLIPFLEEIKFPLNIAILPELDYSRTVNIMALNAGHEILLHLPLEPLSGEKMEERLEKVTIRKDMTSEEVREVLRRFLNGLQGVRGVNNHMGSLISKDEDKLREIFRVLKKRRMYYLDSKVIPDSVASKVAKEVGIRCFQRDVFIDNKDDEEYIKNQIRKGIEMARKKGYSIIIGHAKYHTLRVIKEMVPEIIEYTIPIKLSGLELYESPGH
ncbi:MAG: hypothetical protein B6D53_03840 [Candidatus Omnitrophica bacterium 4484_49]|nr:MAG: hypothetical protein B6D53_03840 [Candidatus Omnitrophica bacterium 4484_49]